jgi:hypothetical protein
MSINLIEGSRHWNPNPADPSQPKPWGAGLPHPASHSYSTSIPWEVRVCFFSTSLPPVLFLQRRLRTIRRNLPRKVTPTFNGRLSWTLMITDSDMHKKGRATSAPVYKSLSSIKNGRESLVYVWMVSIQEFKLGGSHDSPRATQLRR